MRRRALAPLVLALALCAAAATAAEGATRRFAFEYEVVVPAEVEGPESLTLFLPIADDTTGQRILSVELDAGEGVEGRFAREARHGNKYWVAELPAKRAKPTRVAVRYDVERAVVRAGDERGNADSARAFLGPDRRVPVGDPVLEPILREIRAASPGGSKRKRARAIYDWVVDNVEYKKTGTGWGNGDTFWACNERYGNCTDFHSLFISLARTEGIPARFEMGFPVPLDRPAGTIAGYHCWVEFWLPGEGWIPIDASEASKHPERRELFYGTQPADRLQLSRGRDLRLGEGHRGRTLNYFVYPYLEGDGKRLDVPIETRFSYE